ncbi:MAG: WbqC family protein [Christensenellaceae bacterium]
MNFETPNPNKSLTLAVNQSNYMPWKGFFDLIHSVDLFLFYDEVQYTKNDWRNRNRIKTNAGVRWLTLPCGYDIHKSISDVTLNPNIDWQKAHYEKLKQYYKKAPYFHQFKDFLEDVYLDKKWKYLSELNQYTIQYISNTILKCNTKFQSSTDYFSHGKKQEKLLSLLQSAKADTYISGPAAKCYMDVDVFSKNHIKVLWKSYSDYPVYPQINGEFEHCVSILDLIFNTGSDAPYYIWGHRDQSKSVGFHTKELPQK